MPLSDITLARRLEGAERDANARAMAAPSVGAAWIDVNGTYAMFDGPSSPCTQTFGFGLFAPAAEADLATIEQFFAERASPVYHEVSPLADAAHIALLSGRGYRPVEYSSVMYRALQEDVSVNSVCSAVVSRVGPRDAGRWADTLAAGWSDVADVGPVVRDLAGIMAARPDGHLFLAEEDGRAIAAASMTISSGVALLAGASTIPAARGRGAQSALLASRLRYAAGQGCDLAMVVALPGSGSQRNAERNGFRIAYTRTKWSRQI